ncbi:MAG: ABC transporter substrate-binding protein [Eubacteriales bacterium]
MRRRILSLAAVMLLVLSLLTACSGANDAQTAGTGSTTSAAATTAAATTAEATTAAATTAAESTTAATSAVSDVSTSATTAEAAEESYDGKLVFDHSMELQYAKCFSVDYYKGGYKWIRTVRGASVLVVPDGMSVPEGIDEDTFVLMQPAGNILVSSTPVTSLIHAVGALDAISLTTYDADSWYIEDVKNAILDGDLTYIGDYKAPDFEMITDSGCTFAIFSTMLTDDVAAQLDQLGIYVMLDASADEDHPLARVEWAKLYGAMFGCEEQAEEVFNTQASYVEEIAKLEDSDKTVAIFYITSKGKLYARNADDYMAKMVDLAGGEYALSDVGVGETGTVNMEMEAFYDKAKDADYIIYIYSLGGKPETMEEFLSRSEVLSEMKAVKEGNVWCTTPDFFQIQDTIGSMINDIHLMLEADADTDALTYLKRLK